MSQIIIAPPTKTDTYSVINTGKTNLVILMIRRGNLVDCHISGDINASDGGKVSLALIPEKFRPLQGMISIPLIPEDPSNQPTLLFIHSNGANGVYGQGKSIRVQGNMMWMAQA